MKVNRRLISVCTVLLCVFILTYVNSSVAQTNKKTFNLRMQILFGPSMMYQYDPFIDYVEKASNGRIKIQAFSGGQIVPNDQMLDACAEGTIDIAGGAGGYWSDVIPVAIMEGTLPFGLRSITDVNTFYYQRGFLELVREAYAEHGVYYLGPQMCDFAYIMANKPVKTLEDLQKLKFRAVPNIGKLLGKAGVSSVYMNAQEVYMAISTGTLDGVIYGGAVAAESMSFQEVAPYYMTPPINPANQNLIISMKTWNKLPEDLQKILEMATQVENLYMQTINWNLEFKKRQEMMKNDGLEVVQMNDELVETLTKHAKEMWDEVATRDEYTKKGVEILKSYMKDVGYIN